MRAMAWLRGTGDRCSWQSVACEALLPISDRCYIYLSLGDGRCT